MRSDHEHVNDTARPAAPALDLLSSQRPRDVGWPQAAGLLFGDWGTSRLYVLGLAFFFARQTSFYLILGMSVLVLAVGWAYSHICRIYPDGGGVYSAARHKSRTLAVVGALLLFADYVVTASLSALDAFHYFGLDAHGGTLLAWNSPGLWAINAILVIGILNLLGPRHSGRFAIAAAVGMIGITLLITLGALPQVKWSTLPQLIGGVHQRPGTLWLQFVGIVLALSGVEAVGNLTGVMKKPVARTARRAIWIVAIEVALFNILLAVCMVAVVRPEQQSAHKEDMLAFLSGQYIGHWAEIAVRVVAGALLLSACNTVVTDMISVQYLMSRDGELPQAFQGLNRFGVPLAPALIATVVPCLVLIVSHDLEKLAALYAIGVVGAVAINVTLVATHPRLHRWWRRAFAFSLGGLLVIIWVTLASTKLHALAFVAIVMAVGLCARFVTRWLASRKGERPSLLRQAILEQLSAEQMARPRIMLGTYGSDRLAPAALALARERGAALVVCFIRQVSLSYKWGAQKLTLDTDLAAQRTFTRFLQLGHDAAVPVIPVYDQGEDAAELLAENAAAHGVERVLIGSSRQGAMHRLIKGSFQRHLEAMLPQEIPVTVVPNLKTGSDLME